MSELSDAYADLIACQPWHWFVTLTFRLQHEGSVGGVHPEKADKAFRFFVSNLNRELFGKNWHRKRHGGVIWVRGQEFHQSGRIHFHAVMAAPEFDLNAQARRLSWMDFWFREFGIARIERPACQEHVASYVSKYVVKGGEIDFSANFGKWRPPSLFALEASSPAALH